MSRAGGNKPKVVYWNNMPAPYMVERFNALAKRGNLDFEAWFNDRARSDRSWDVEESTWAFRYRYLPSVSLGKHTIHFPTSLLRRGNPQLLVSLYAEPVFLFGWVLAKIVGLRTAFWCEVTMDRWVQRRRWKEWLKSIVFPRADALLGAGEDGRRYAMRYGVSGQRAISLPHSIDVVHYSAKSREAKATRDALRAKLGLKGTTFIYVGRLWWGKGLRFLIDAFAELQEGCGEQLSLMLVGDGEEEDSLKALCRERGVENVKFVGFKQKADLPKYYCASDVFVFPTLGDPYGLVVDEAMACSLPVVSTTAAGEIRGRVIDGHNGYLVPPEDTESLSRAMRTLAENESLRQEMGQRSAAMIADHTPEKWAEEFERIVSVLLDRAI